MSARTTPEGDALRRELAKLYVRREAHCKRCRAPASVRAKADEPAYCGRCFAELRARAPAAAIPAVLPPADANRDAA